jgi:act minimal PKS acyl carrier protein
MSETAVLSALASALEAVGVDDAADRLAESQEITFEELEIDSLAVIEVVARISTECGIDIPDDELGNFRSPADIVEYCTQPTAKAA